MDDAGELGAIQGLCDVVRAVVLDEGQQLLPTALPGQDLEDVGEAWTEQEHREGVRSGRSKWPGALSSLDLVSPQDQPGGCWGLKGHSNLLSLTQQRLLSLVDTQDTTTEREPTAGEGLKLGDRGHGT